MPEPPKPHPVQDAHRQLDEMPAGMGLVAPVALNNPKVRAQGGTPDAPAPEPEPEHAVKPKPNSKSKQKQKQKQTQKQKQKQKPKQKPKKSAPAGDDDDDAFLAAAMAENAALRQAQQQEELHAAEEMLQSRTYTNFDERNRALAFKQMATRTIIPGQALPKEVTTALQIALKEIEAEDAAAGRGEPALTGAAEADQPFQNAPPSSTNDPRMLRRQKIMVERMRRKRHENKEKQQLALDDPVEAQNCKRYNLTANQLRAVRRTGLRLPHECREQTAAKLEAAAIDEEDVLFPDDMSLDDMFGALREDDRFMGSRTASKNVS